MKTIRYSVTGVTGATHEDAVVLYNAITELKDVTEFTTGAAHGVDTLAAFTAFHVHGTLTREGSAIVHRVVIPDAPYNEVWNEPCPWWVTRQLAPARKSNAKAYMARNDLLVAHADVLLAFPRTAQEELRSGTWATVRRARKKGIPVHIFPLT